MRVPHETVLVVEWMPEPMAPSGWNSDLEVSFLKKPFGSRTLVRTVRRMLDGS